METHLQIPINVDGHIIELTIYSENSTVQTLYDVGLLDASLNSESRYQLCEGCFYEYLLTSGYYLAISDVVSRSQVNPSSGRISPNIYVGTISLDVIKSESNDVCGSIDLEVRSVKTSYREDYRIMLTEITEKCVDIILRHNSLASNSFKSDYKKNSETLYQRFAFLKSVLDTEEFNNVVHKILSSPVTKWKGEDTQRDPRSLKKIGKEAIRQITSASNRVALHSGHPLRKMGISTLPSKVVTLSKAESIDTQENRFIKYALESFLNVVEDFRSKVEKNARLNREALVIENNLRHYLGHNIFKDVALLKTLSINSPILQRKEGYREILRIWLMHELAAQLVWEGGEDVYKAGQKDIATLYEYWLFFKLLEVIGQVFKVDVNSVSKLIEATADGLDLKLKQGDFLAIDAVYEGINRKLRIQLSYNRTFSGKKSYPKGGSWTRDLRPDYTLSIWPDYITSEQAELEELIVHIHFDAKYKVDNIFSLFSEDENLNVEKDDQKKGAFKRADLLKMHTYKDAIRRTAGAYILYPGSINYSQKGFHELLPGLGAFAISPSSGDNGIEHLRAFLEQVTRHFLNRTSQREKMSLRTYQTHRDQSNEELNEPLPEAYGNNREFQPDDTFVLVGFYKNQDHLNWIIDHKLYNARTGTGNGSIHLDTKTVSAQYILLHGPFNSPTYLFKLSKEGPRLFSRADMVKKDYTDPKHELYLVFHIDGECEIELRDRKWDVTKLDGFKLYNRKAEPFATSLSEIVRKSGVKD